MTLADARISIAMAPPLAPAERSAGGVAPPRRAEQPSAAAAVATALAHQLPPARTVWGLDPVQLHTRYWAAHGVQVVRQGEPSEIVQHAELYLLTDPRSLTLFKLSPLMDALNWIKPQVLCVRLHDTRERAYRENVVTDASGRFVRFQRLYDASNHLARVVLTPDREIAQMWQSSPDPLTGWRRLRRLARRTDRASRSINGATYDRNDPRELAHFMHDLVATWRRPDSTVMRAARRTGAGSEVWIDSTASIEGGVKFIGPVWVGANRRVPENETVIGPTVIWDDASNRPDIEAIQWLQIEPTEPPPEPLPRPIGLFDRASKRAFDLVLSAIGLLCTLPLYPLIMIAIWLEDGGPFFFSHRRETLNGREFGCIKFRSMRKDAEKLKAELKARNQADGPQFFIENDPRLTKVGRFLRRYNLDELPQFLNVLAGQMSIVGPRPSPHHENQFCPAWREARLSVRPGITGLWQIKRTRRRGSDFQEWIRYDIEYVEKRSWRLDLYIIWKTVSTILFKVSRT